MITLIKWFTSFGFGFGGEAEEKKQPGFSDRPSLHAHSLTSFAVQETSDPAVLAEATSRLAGVCLSVRN
jgi:hypothetical protein